MRRSTRRAHPFSSYARALCWFEDRRHLLSFPLVVGCAAILHLLLIFWLEDVQENKFRLGINFLGIPPLLAPILGIRLGRSGSSPKTAYLLSSFTATRPVGTTSLVAAKLKTAALSTLWACGVLVLLASVWFFGTGLHRQMPDWWRGMYAENRHWKVAATALLVGAVLFLITWRLLVDGICAALTGRSWIAHGNLLLHGVALTAGVMIGADALSRYADYQRVRDALPWCAGAAVFIRLLLAVWLVRILVQRQLVEGRTLVGLTILWAATAAALFGLAWHVIPEGLVSPWLLFCGVMLALPLVRLSATPLALAWNRHR